MMTIVTKIYVREYVLSVAINYSLKLWLNK
jgi:hypothetical protein